MKSKIRFNWEIVLALLFILPSCGKNNFNESAELEYSSGSIVNGTAVGKSDFRSVVAIVKNGKIICSGNLISSTEIITAAHCVAEMEHNNAGVVKGIYDRLLKEVSADVKDVGWESLDLSNQRLLINQQYTNKMLKDAARLRIHVGVGVPGRLLSGEYQVSQVVFSAATLKLLTSKFVGKTDLAQEEDSQAKYKDKLDVAILKLEKPVEGVHPIPMISEDEYDDILVGESVSVVGFGAKIDPGLVNYLGSKFGRAYLNYKNEVNEEKKKVYLKAYQESLELYLRARSVLSTTGEKFETTLLLRDITESNLELVAPNNLNPQGACFGDSGGPAFVKISDGTLRQVGVITRVNFCGNLSLLAPLR